MSMPQSEHFLRPKARQNTHFLRPKTMKKTHFLSSKINIRQSTKICTIEFKSASSTSFQK